MYFNKVKGLPGITCALPKTSPLSKDASVSDNIELLRVHMITWFSGVDIFKTLLEDFAYLDDETNVFTCVSVGEYDTNAGKSEAYRKIMGDIFATAFLKDEETACYDHATTLCVPMGHASMASLRADFAQWCQFGKSLEGMLAVVLTWLGKVDDLHMYSLTAGLCGPGKTHSDLPFPSLYKMIALVRLVDGNTSTALLGMQKEFDEHLANPGGTFLNEKWCTTLLDLIVRLTKAPEKTKDIVAHIPRAMTARIMNTIVNIPTNTALYTSFLLSTLQHNVTKMITSDNPATRAQHGLPQILVDVQAFIQNSANMRASLANDSQLLTASVGLPGVNEQAQQIPQYRPQATPGPTPNERGGSRNPPDHTLRDHTAKNARSPGRGSTLPRMTTPPRRRADSAPW